jgi:MFS family permease
MNIKIPTGKNVFFYGWVILAIATFSLVISNGLAIYGIPAFYKFIREDFVKSGAVAANQAESFIANGASLTFLLAGFFSPVAGWLIQKYNLRVLMAIGCVILGSSFILHSQAETANAVYLSRILMGISLGLIGVLINTILVSNWFRRLRGTAIGILLTGTSIGGFIVPPIATALILQYGWRFSMILLSLLVWIVLLPAVIFLVRSRPADMGLLPDNDSRVEQSDNGKSRIKKNLAGFTLGEAVRTPLFWIFAFCAALIFYPIFVTGQQFILYLQTEKIGLSPQNASYALSALFAVSVGGKFLFGFLSDKFSPTRVMLMCCSVMFLASLALLSLTANTAFLFLIPFGLGYGGTFVLLQRLVADFFGMREYGKILGVIMLIETIGAAIGGQITGKLADAAGGDYTQAFYGVIITTGMALFLIVIMNFMSQPQKTENPAPAQS